MNQKLAFPYFIILKLLIAIVWLINGLFCKVLNLVPRHQQIVGRILGEEYAELLTRTIGVLEILMALWIISEIKPRLCILTQIILVMSMNIIEFTLAPDLLLFGRVNLIIAFVFVAILSFYDYAFIKKRSYHNFNH